VTRCEGLGTADFESGRRVTRDTIFHVASLGKPIVGIAVMQLVQEGVLSLDDDVSERIHFSVRNPAHPRVPITLRELLTHTASIQDDFDTLRAASVPGDPSEALRPFLERYFTGPKRVRGGFLDVAPGSRYAYSNVGAALAALVVESVKNEAFDRYAARTIFGPLKMGAAYRLSALDRGRVAVPHVRRGESAFESRPLMGRPVYPASDLRASACDLALLLGAMLGGGAIDGARVLLPASVDLMLAATDLPAGQRGALGWQELHLGDRTVIGHEGEDAGASAVMAIDRARHVGAVVVANGDAFSSGDESRAKALSDLLSRLLNEP